MNLQPVNSIKLVCGTITWDKTVNPSMPVDFEAVHSQSYATKRDVKLHPSTELLRVIILDRVIEFTVYNACRAKLLHAFRKMH